MMSEERRRYLHQSARQVSITPALDAAEEDEETAFQRYLLMQQRERLQAELTSVGQRDPQLCARLQAEIAALDASLPVASAPAKPYDPSRLYARMAHYYGWTYDYLDEMDYSRFFAAAREMYIALQEERDARRQPGAAAQVVESSQQAEWALMAQAGPGPEVWPGEVLDR